MTYETIEVRQLTPLIGAEIGGVDMRDPPDNQTFQAIHDAWMEHQVILFRDQDITLEQQKDFGRRFGELAIHPAAPGPEGHPEIFVLHADENSKFVEGNAWHTDVSCDEKPPLGSLLHLHTVPPVGGDTLFASTYAAYDDLSADMKTYLDGKLAIHDGEHVYRGRYAYQGIDDSGRTYPHAEHPVVRTHPVTGRKGLFVNTGFTVQIKDLPQRESRAVLDFLYDHIAQPKYQCRFKWAPNSVAMWDNRCVQHFAMWDYFPATRSGNRVTLEGDKPF